jgi:hypothetical protein
MRAYVESSVVLRAVLAEPGRLAAWSRIEDPMTSEITRVECLRTLDRLRLAGGMPDRELARRRATVSARNRSLSSKVEQRIRGGYRHRYSETACPVPPSSIGRSFSFGAPSRMRRTVSP